MINVKKFGAVGDWVTDDTQAIQRAIDHAKGRPIRIPSGKYLITSSLNYITTGDVQGLQLQGDGVYQTILLGTGKGPVINLDGSGTAYAFQRGGMLRDFSIQGGERGLDIRSNWHLSCDRINIRGVLDDAIRIINRNGQPSGSSDTDGSCFLSFDRVSLSFNGGCGLRVALDNGPGSTGPVTFRHCLILNNGKEGIRFFGWPLLVEDCSIAGNDKGGLLFGFRDSPGSGHVQPCFTVQRNEFDSNGKYQVKIAAATGGSITENRFSAKGGGGLPPVASVLCQIGEDTNEEIYTAGIYVGRNTTGQTDDPYTVAYWVGKICIGVRLDDNCFVGSSCQKYEDDGKLTKIYEAGVWKKGP